MVVGGGSWVGEVRGQGQGRGRGKMKVVAESLHQTMKGR